MNCKMCGVHIMESWDFGDSFPNHCYDCTDKLIAERNKREDEQMVAVISTSAKCCICNTRFKKQQWRVAVDVGLSAHIAVIATCEACSNRIYGKCKVRYNHPTNGNGDS